MDDRILCRHVIAGAARHFGCSRESLTEESRGVPLVYARHIAMHVARSFGYSYPKVGRCFNRDHSTVKHAVSKIQSWIDDDDEMVLRDVRSVHDLALAEAALEQAVTRAHVARLEEARAS